MHEEMKLAEWRPQVGPALKSKMEELHFMGYESVTEDEIWKCILSRAKKQKEEEWRIHQVINTIMRLSTNDFMNWLTIQAVTDDQWYSFDTLEGN
ncbi:post-transcriptional regulator [Pseudalkalibacillus berkeleyi]|uniref:Post-transcriptional regulator n=1 Tax=Pseudalkalibacillus berkeleyi TaxID=1069813 RepID=A0ABS9H2C0_9BACL|nr:post-transcriptional regulator [Pseudalkalibacillus berkeleyi]MCF6138066.1 post-transcriptional regulator [Pseudalkalibacillus berkeleyi]